MQIGVDQDVFVAAPGHRSPGLAHLKCGLKQPTRKGFSQLVPALGQFVAVPFGHLGDLRKHQPLRAVVGPDAQVAKESTPMDNGFLDGQLQQRTGVVQTFNDHGPQRPVAVQELHSPAAAPQLQGNGFQQRFFEREGHLQGGCNAVGCQHRKHKARMPVPRQFANGQVECQLPLLQGLADQTGQPSQPTPALAALPVAHLQGLGDVKVGAHNHELSR